MQQHMARMESFQQKMQARMSGRQLTRHETRPCRPPRAAGSPVERADPQADTWPGHRAGLFFVGRARTAAARPLGATTLDDSRGRTARAGCRRRALPPPRAARPRRPASTSSVIPAARASARAASLVSPDTISAGSRVRRARGAGRAIASIPDAPSARRRSATIRSARARAPIARERRGGVAAAGDARAPRREQRAHRATTAGSSSTTTTRRPREAVARHRVAVRCADGAAPPRGDGAAARRAARVTEKREPRPGVDASVERMVEQRAEAAHDREAEPHAAPAHRGAAPAPSCTNSSKMRSRSARAMPTPVSTTSMRTAAPRRRAPTHDAAASACSAARWRRGCAGSARAAPDRCRRSHARRHDAQREPARRRLRREVGREPREQRRRARRRRAPGAARRHRAATGRAAARTAPPSASTDAWMLRDQRLHLRIARLAPTSAAAKRPIACSGWRRSWLAAARNWLFARFAVSAAARARLRRPRLRLELVDQVDVLVADRERVREQRR